MQTDISPLKNFFNDLKHIKEPLPRFRVAQLLFIWSLTFAWCKESFMRITAGLALLLMWKTMPLPRFSLERKDFSRTTWCLVLMFFIWIFTMPLAFGTTTISQELWSFVKPLEALVFILLSLFFFRGENFEERFAFWSVLGLCAFIFSCAINRYMNNFADVRGLDTFLGFTPTAALQYISMWLGCLVCYMFKNKSNLLLWILAMAAFAVAPCLSLVTYYGGAIFVCGATLAFSLFFAFLLIRQSVAFKLFLAISMIIIAGGIVSLFCFSDKFAASQKIWQNHALSIYTTLKNVTPSNLTSGRFGAVLQAMGKIKEKPITGHGLGLSSVPSGVKPTKSVAGELNNTMLQVTVQTGLVGFALFALSRLVLFILAMSKTVASKKQALYFTFVIMIIAKFFSGFTDGVFMPNIYFLAPFWCLAFYVIFNESQTDEPESV